MTHYCHNCRYHALLPDTVHCAWCLAFFYAHSRMPRPTDRAQRQSTASDPGPAIARLWDEIDNRGK